jgi:2-isopropylmalate synthase
MLTDELDAAAWTARRREPFRACALHDETLRDGLQSPSVVDPPLWEKVEILRGLVACGVDSVNLGLPAAGARARQQVEVLAAEIAREKLPIAAGCAGRTVVGDVVPIAEASQRAGIPITAMLFVGSSAIRHYTEGWTVEFVRDKSLAAIDFAVKEGLPVVYVTEDTTRAAPEVLDDLFRAAIEHGATRLCLCDTVGHATPHGIDQLVRFVRGVVARTGATVGLDFHGHDDRGFALANALAAIEAGVDRAHGCVLGIGERCGNTPLDLLLLHLDLMDALRGRRIDALPALCDLVARSFDAPVPPWHPLRGAVTARDRTADRPA